MYESVFTSIERNLRSEAGMASDLHYVEQISWVLFLKYLSDYEEERKRRAALEGKTYTPVIIEKFRWGDWACPKDESGKFNHKKAAVGDDLIGFVNNELFPYLGQFKQFATGHCTIEYKIGEIFTELDNKFRSGYNLREVISEIDKLSFKTQDSLHELSNLYETRIRRMGNAGRNGGEYYTPRPLIRAMVCLIAPKIGETVYDGAAGSAGFLCEAYEYMRQGKLSAKDVETLQTKTFFGQEKKALAYIIGIINMILHGVEAPNLIHTNTLNENVRDIQSNDRHDIVLANPPFGGGERKEVQHNFRIPSGETAYLFLQHFIGKLKAGGRAAVVIKNTFLSNTDSASVELRKHLLGSCNLHTILDCPSGTFQGAGVKTVVLFFRKGSPSKDIWYYQLDPGRSLGKTNPLNDDDLAEFVSLQPNRKISEKSWIISVADIDEKTYDLSVKNPNTQEEAPLRPPHEIINGIIARDAKTKSIIENIRGIV